MKKTILTAIALTCAVGAFAQGTVSFNNRVGGTSHVWIGGSTQIRGQASNDGNPGGTTDYSGLTLIGASGSGGVTGSSFYLAQLLGAPGANQAEGSLVAAASAPTSFRTGTSAGGVAVATASFNNIPNDAPVATFQMVAWDNHSGLYSTWALASAAWQAGLIAAGSSAVFNLNSIGGVVNTPPNLFPGLTSFNIYTVPEPSTIALAGLGAAALVIFRRRK
jgi:hypothetical protein